MAAFNPDVKDVKPINPIGWSHSAEVPSSFASGISEAVKGIGNTIQLGAKAGVDVVEDVAAKGAEAKFRPIVNDRISELAGEDFRIKMGLASGTSSNSTVTSGNIDEAVIPGDLKGEIKSLSILPDARANGKISPSDYYGRLMAAASDLRSRYPVGFRDYIDKEISKITGVDPANAYMQSLTADINANQTHVQAERNKIANEILTLHGKDPTAPQAYENFRNGGSTRDALNWISRVKAVDVKHERTMQEVAEMNAKDKATEHLATQSFQTYISGSVATTLTNTAAVQGLTGQKIQDIMVRELKTPTMTSPQYLQLANQMQGLMEQDRAKFYKELDFIDKDPNSRTYRPVPLRTILGEKGTKMIENGLEAHQKIIENLRDGKIGLAMNTKMITEAIQNDSVNVFWKDPEFAAVFGPIKALEGAGGQGAVVQGWSSIIMKDGKLPDIQKVSIQTKLAELATAPDPRGPNFKNVNNFKEAITKIGDEADKLGDERYKFSAADHVISLIDGQNGFSITDPTTKPNVVTNIFRNFFSPDTRGALRLINTDIRDPRTNAIIPGQESWYKRMTSPEVVAKANIQDDVTKNWYLTWTKMTFDDLFTKSINNLGSKEFKGAYTVSWHPEDRINPLRVDINNLQAMGDIRRFTGQVAPIEDDIRSVNKGITGLYSVYRGMGLDEKTAERQVLEKLRLTLPQLKAVNGIPKDFLDSIEEPYKKKMEEEAAKAKTNQNYIP